VSQRLAVWLTALAAYGGGAARWEGFNRLALGRKRLDARDETGLDEEQPDSWRVGKPAPRLRHSQAAHRKDAAGRHLYRALKRYLQPLPGVSPAPKELTHTIVPLVEATIGRGAPLEFGIHASEHPLKISFAPTTEHPRHDSQIVASHRATLSGRAPRNKLRGQIGARTERSYLSNRANLFNT
jgi:hypothetical protein